MPASEGTGTTVAFGTSSFTAEILNIQQQGGAAREALPTSHLGTTLWKTFKPSQLKDGGTYTLTVHYDGDQDPPVAGAPETVTITYPLVAGQTNEGTRAFSAFITEATVGTIENESIIVMQITLKVTGAITDTASS
jgi:hypothetical protein